MNTLNFLFNNKSLNIYGSVQEPIFVVNQVCQIIKISNESTLIQSIKKDVRFIPSAKEVDPLFQKGGIPNNFGQKLSLINERGLYEIMFRSRSQLADKFRDEIYEWLKQSRLQNNQIKDQMIQKLQQSNDQSQTQIMKLKDDAHIAYLSNNFNHRITLYKNKFTNKLLFGVSFHYQNRRQQEKYAIDLLSEMFEENILDVTVERDMNHYQKQEAREIIREMSPKFMVRCGQKYLVNAYQ